MIGNLVHYNCGGSKALGIIVDLFRYENPGRARSPVKNNDLMIAVEWIKFDKNMPAPLTPRYLSFTQDYDADEKYWPMDWDKRQWYNYRWFKVISKADVNT